MEPLGSRDMDGEAEGLSEREASESNLSIPSYDYGLITRPALAA
jgi:hypothetical protein